jgi:hypothetical protein
MNDDCRHFHEVTPKEGHTDGCEESLKIGDSWVHLRVCLVCGHKDPVPALAARH